jgi:peptidoglycan/xylan/chitin deacetylase (PgdA/CDA1 family)
MEEHVDFQSHGRFHFSMPTLEEKSLLDELWESKERVEELTGRSVLHFSFPYGDHGSREIDAVVRAAYFTARTTEPGWITVDTDRFRLPIVADVPRDASVMELRAHLTGLPRVAKRLAYRWLTRRFHAARARRLVKRTFFRRQHELALSGGPSNPSRYRAPGRARRKEDVARF